MCRSIKVLRREEPATLEEIDAAALQFVRKIAGMRKPSRRNEEAFDAAVRDIASISQRLLDSVSSHVHGPGQTHSHEPAATHS